jgi:predicted CoA-binding protein
MKTKETIVVLGASNNPARTSYMATRFLDNKGFNLVAVSNKKGNIGNLIIQDDSTLADIHHVDTITVFLNAERQRKYYESIVSMHPKRIIFNPGTENPELVKIAHKHNIQVVSGCTIALLTSGLL